MRTARAKIEPGIKIEVEVTNFEEAKEAVEAGASMIMLDNMSLMKMRKVIEWVKGRVPVEVSGKVTLRRARQIASLGVDYVSIGGLTHSFASVDISMEFMKGRRCRRTSTPVRYSCHRVRYRRGQRRSGGRQARLPGEHPHKSPSPKNPILLCPGRDRLSGARRPPEILKEDIIKTGDGINNPESVEVLARQGRDLVEKILIGELQIPFTRSSEDDLDYAQEAGHSRRRILHVKDTTGRTIEEKFIRR